MTPFSETQRFSQWWILLIFLIVNGFFLYGIFRQVIGGQPLGDNPMSNTGLIVATGISLLLTYLFFGIRLETKIKNDGIHVRLFPFHRKFKHYPWSDVKKSFVRQYSPLSEYGGWGLRTGLAGKGTAYNVSGNRGLQLEFNNGKKLLIGTRKPEEITEALNRLGRLKP